MTEPEPFPSTRREARELALLNRRLSAEQAVQPRHRRRSRAARARGAAVLSTLAALLVWGTVSVTSAVAGPPAVPVAAPEPAVIAPLDPAPGSESSQEPIRATVVPIPENGLPTPEFSASAAGRALCDEPAVIAALEARDDPAVIAAAGGAQSLRDAVASGTATCIPLDDPSRLWSVINKQRPYTPVDFVPDGLVIPEGVPSVYGGSLRADAAASLAGLVAAARDAGVGELAIASAYRSFATQQSTYSGHVADRGVEGADLVSARPGHSEHQSGLGVDLVACWGGACGTLDELAATPQGQWLAQHSWEHGWIVRYTEGRTDVTGYSPEPWHLRYIGPDLARAYHEGGWTTLEEFFGLPAAPTYPG